MRRATIPPCGSAARHRLFLSTLSLRRATATRPTRSMLRSISIHALLAESDPKKQSKGVHHEHFYPRSPCGERLCAHLLKSWILSFLSTLSLRRATCGWCGVRMPNVFLSTLSLRRATGRHQKQDGIFRISIHALLAESDPHIRSTSHGRPNISIHALLAESDCFAISAHCFEGRFLSTLSLRRATSKSAQNSGALLRI